ncbi:MAG TPA: aminomethyl-transferring glycine dehydrogenase subunit GcvPB [Candidatus Binataceae bacterium]|nr:aminomethyl-transferring glycine dehydrogenase subunit GcvPB [Candidatus Binataceae bacterium]
MATAGRIARIEPVAEPPHEHRSEPVAGVPLIFERSSSGRRGADLPQRAEGTVRGAEILGRELCREDLEGFPELSEPQVLRHFLQLSQLNFGQALQFYPLGSCTMKYNPVLNDEMASLAGFAALHPATPPHLAQGALELMERMERALAEITGMDAVSLHPAAGAQGELSGLLMVRAYHKKRGAHRHKVIIPDTAHGTNPASCTLAGFKVIVAKSNKRGFLAADEVRRLVDDDVAAMMVTNPNTLGIFEPEIGEIASVLHERGALLYLDGANMNALLGVAKPGHMGADIVQLNLHKTFSTPHGGGGPGAGPIAVRAHLEQFLPMPRLKRTPAGLEFDSDRPDAIGRMRSYHNNFGMIVRAYAFILALGGDGLALASRLAILGANYIRKRLEDHYPSATREPSMHECVLTHDLEKRADVSTLEIAKRLLDFKMHPPTIYFPLVVPGALMIEPTETESREILDSFIDTMERIYEEALSEPDLIKTAPRTLVVSRVDEAEAARKPILRWWPEST